MDGIAKKKNVWMVSGSIQFEDEGMAFEKGFDSTWFDFASRLNGPTPSRYRSRMTWREKQFEL